VFSVHPGVLHEFSKKLINPITLTQYSLFPKSTSSTSTKSHFGRKIQPFFWRGHGQKIPIRMHQNTPFLIKNLFFILERGLAPPHTPPRWGAVLPFPYPIPRRPTKSFAFAPASPRITAILTPLQEKQKCWQCIEGDADKRRRGLRTPALIRA